MDFNKKVKAYLKLNGSGSLDTGDDSNLTMESDGTNMFISYWNVNGIPQPTDEQLNSDSNLAEAALITSQSNAIENRRVSYPSMRDQFDMIFHELNESGSLSTSGNWFTTIKNIKDSNPKS